MHPTLLTESKSPLRMLFILLFFLVLVFFLLFLASANIAKTKTPLSEKNATPSADTQNPSISENAYQNPFKDLADATVVYPIKELGNCGDKNACVAFCSIAKNTPACWSYATFVLNKEVLGVATSSASPKVPSCDADPACKSYCQTHASECPGFSSSETTYLGPKGCRSQTECQTYCSAHPSLCPGFPNYTKPTPSETISPQPTTESTPAE